MELLTLIPAIIYLLALLALIYFLQDAQKTLKGAKQQVQSLQVVYDVARNNNKILEKQIDLSRGLNDCSSDQWSRINSLENQITNELNTWESKRHSYEALFKPINRSRKKKNRGKRRQ